MIGQNRLAEGVYMRKKDTISIIVPVYNVGKYLERCVESIIRQTYDKLQIILVDDGSTDQSGFICDNLAKRDSRICVFHKNWGGTADTRNVGLAFAVGEYISFVDGDDYIHDTMMQEMVMALQRNDCDIAVCGRYDIFERKFKARNRKSFCLKEEKVYGKEAVVREYFKCRDIEPSSCCDKMFHSSIIEGLCFPTSKTSEDFYFAYNAFQNAKKVVHVAKPLYYYCHRKGSMSTTIPVELTELEVMDFLEKIEKKLWKDRKIMILKAFYSFYVSTFNVVHEEIRKSAKVDASFSKYMFRLKMDALTRLVFVLASPDILPQIKKAFIKTLLSI